MSARGGSRTSTFGLTLRSMGAFRGGLVALAVVVLIATVGVVAWPAITLSLVSADARHRLEQAPPAARTISGVVPATNYVDPVRSAQQIWDALPAALTEARHDMPPALRSTTRPGTFVGRSDGVPRGQAAGPGIPVVPVQSDPQRSSLGFSVEADPLLHKDATLDAGHWPTGGYAGGVLDVAMSSAAAKQLHWHVGATRTLVLSHDAVATSGLSGALGASGAPTLKLKLTGTVSPADPHADLWMTDPVRKSLGASVSADPNLRTTLYHGVVWMDPDAWPPLAMALGDPYLTATFGVDDSNIDLDSLRPLAAAATSFIADPIVFGTGQDLVQLRLTSNLPDIVQQILRRIGSVPTLLAIVAAGPLGAAVAVLFTGARLMASRRGRSLELMRARGGSELRVRGGAAMEAAMVAVPAALVGGIAAAWTTHAGASAVPLIVACAVVPPCAVAVTASSVAGSRRARPVLSWMAELLVVLLAAASCVVLVQRGSTAITDPMRVDPLLVLTPVLVVFAVCVLVLRLYPFVLRGIGGMVRGASGAVGLVGWAGAVRGGAARLWPLFAMLTGVAVAVFAGNTLVAVVAGSQQDALTRVGADLTVRGNLTSTQWERLRAVPGVADAVALRLVGYGDASSGQTVPTYLVDVRGMAAVQADLPASARVFGEHTEAALGGSGGAAAALGGFPSDARPTSFSFDNDRLHVPVHVVAHGRASDAPFLTDDVWAFLDESAVPKSLRAESTVTGALVSLDPGTDARVVEAAVQKAAGSGAQADSAAAELERQRGGPLVPGIQNLMLAGSVLALLLAIGALLLTLAMGRAARTRLLGVLRTLGFDRSQSGALVAWEVAPVTATAIVAGAATGIGLSAVVLGALDLRPVTGSLARPEFAVSWPVVGAVVGVFAVGAVAAVTIAVVVARRADTAQAMRAEEEA